MLKQLKEAKKKLLLVQGQLGLEVDHWKEATAIGHAKNEKLEQSLTDTRKHYETMLETLRGQLEQSKSRDSAVSSETAALTSDLKTANTLLAMQRSKREELQAEVEKLRAANEQLEERLAGFHQKWESKIRQIEKERAEIDTEKEILRSVEETIFLRLKQQLELAELEPTLQAAPDKVSKWGCHGLQLETCLRVCLDDVAGICADAMFQTLALALSLTFFSSPLISLCCVCSPASIQTTTTTTTTERTNERTNQPTNQPPPLKETHSSSKS